MNEKRRKFLKFIIVAGGVAVLAKVFGFGLWKLLFPPRIEKDFDEFKVTKDRKEMIIFDKKGEEILIIDDKK